MSDYVPKVGDIVNVTLRDAEVVVVQEAFGDYDVTVRGNDNGQKREFFYYDGSGTVSVELVKAAEPPKPKWPTTPGSVISYIGGIDSKYVRLPSGKWLSLRRGADAVGTDDDFGADLYEVLYDAGAPR